MDNPQTPIEFICNLADTFCTFMLRKVQIQVAVVEIQEPTPATCINGG